MSIAFSGSANHWHGAQSLRKEATACTGFASVCMNEPGDPELDLWGSLEGVPGGAPLHFSAAESSQTALGGCATGMKLPLAQSARDVKAACACLFAVKERKCEGIKAETTHAGN